MFYNDTATTYIYSLSYTTLFRSSKARPDLNLRGPTPDFLTSTMPRRACISKPTPSHPQVEPGDDWRNLARISRARSTSSANNSRETPDFVTYTTVFRCSMVKPW